MSAVQRLKQGIYRTLERFNFSVHYRKYFFNLSWLFVERIVRMVVSATVGIYVINYLGPERNGILNYAGVFLVIGGTVSTLGLGSIGVKALIQHPEDTDRIIGTSLWLRLIASAILFTGICMYAFLSEDRYTAIIIAVASSSFLIQAFHVPEYYFHATVNAKLLVKAQIVSFILSNALRVAFIWLNLGLIYFVIAQLAEAVVLGILMGYYYLGVKKHIRFVIDKKYSKMFLKESFYLVTTALVVSVYLRIDQFMITKMAGFSENGKYSAAVKISEIFYFLPTIILNTLFPAIVHGKNLGEQEYKLRLQKLYDLLSGLALVLIMGVILFAGIIVRAIFKPEFHEIVPVLQLHVVSALFVFWGSATGRALTVEDKNYITTSTTFLGALINVSLNLYVIPQYGIIGAAVSTVVSYMFAAWVAFAFFKSSRGLFLHALLSLNLLRVLKGFLRTRLRRSG